MTSYILIPFIILNLAIGKIDPIQLNPAYEKTTISQDGVLRGNITVSTDLPQEFYGTWSVIGNIIKTNNPNVFKGKSSDIWTFDKFQEVITLTNPVSKASASIKVNEVQGKTAVFTRENFTDKVKQYEKAKITVDGDKFFEPPIDKNPLENSYKIYLIGIMPILLKFRTFLQSPI